MWSKGRWHTICKHTHEWTHTSTWVLAASELQVGAGGNADLTAASNAFEAMKYFRSSSILHAAALYQTEKAHSHALHPTTIKTCMCTSDTCRHPKKQHSWVLVGSDIQHSQLQALGSILCQKCWGCPACQAALAAHPGTAFPWSASTSTN